MALPAIVPLLALGGGLLLALASSSKKVATTPNGAPPSPTALSAEDEAGIVAWIKANLAPEQIAALGALMSSSMSSKGYVDAHDLCSALSSALSPAQMADVVAHFPVLSTCFDPTQPAPPSDLPGPAPSDETPVIPGATDGAPAPPPVPDGGGGAAAPQMPSSAIPSVPGPASPPAPADALGGYDEALARQLAPSVEASIKAHKRNYDHALLMRFQIAAGLKGDGMYGGGTAGALHYFLGHPGPKPLYAPMTEQPYKATQIKADAAKKPKTQSAAQKAAGELSSYLAASHDFGSKAHPSATVKSYQSLMGGLTADGIVGAKTRARAKALGVILPAAPNASTPVKPSTPGGKPAVTTPAIGGQKQAAVDLGAYLAQTHSFGSKGHPDATVKAKQAAMGGLTADGIVGAKTRARADALGVKLPSGAGSTAPAPHVAASPAAKPSPSSPAPSSPAVNPQKQAAVNLGQYLALSHDFGSKAHPSSTVKASQAAMGGLTADGIVGPKTRARALALGVELPAAGTTAAPSGNAAAQKQAAVNLGQYLASSHDFGSKAHPSATVKSYQGAMGGLTADGIVGPKTRTRAQALGVQLPAAGSAAPAPAHAPATAANQGPTLQKNAAVNLGQYLASTHSFGSRAKPDQTVKTYQAQMGGLTADGIMGAKTRARALALGVQLPQQTGGATSGEAIVDMPSTYDAAEARRLARLVVQDVQQNGQRAYNRGLVSSFQRAAGLYGGGEYDGRTVGALKYFGAKRAPRAQHSAIDEVTYAPPIEL
jgi:hypothetical protein